MRLAEDHGDVRSHRRLWRCAGKIKKEASHIDIPEVQIFEVHVYF